ncbi:alpha/beta hydrolase [Undibacterium sp. Ren11W]|uniref:alpha/beta hydrolase n=1 Tax=Undibacterium sp. Ren11W TaxID=3413045 RepID=UPI003BF3559B
MTFTSSPNAAQWSADILPGFEQLSLNVASGEMDEALEITLVRRLCSSQTEAGKAAVLYIHGFVDYFFQTELADFYHAQGMDFYALDLRRHGRSLRPGHLPNFTVDVNDYLQDVDAAISLLRQNEHVTWLMLNGHSTGGLVAALYAHRGAQKEQVKALFLNSPFLDMNLPAWQEKYAEPVLAWLGKFFPYWRLPGLPTMYGRSLHVKHQGQWDYRTDWKPIAGFPVYAGWFRAIHLAHEEVARGLQIACPCLLLHAGHSLRPKVWSEAAMSADIVLDVADMQRLAPGLGSQLECHAIPDGIHDLVLSRPAARAQVWQLLGAWLNRVRTDSAR